MKSMIASEVMYQVRGVLTVRQPLLLGLGLLQDPLGQQQPRGLAAQLAGAAAGHDDAVEQLEEVADADHFLGHCDISQLFGQEALDEGNAQTLESTHGQAAAPGEHVLVAPDGVGDLGHGAAGVTDHGAEEAGLVLLDPLLDPGEDILVVQIAGGQIERGAGHQDRALQGTPHARHVGLACVLRASRLRYRFDQHLLGFGQADGAQVVEHLARDAQEHLPALLPDFRQKSPPGRPPGRPSPPAPLCPSAELKT